MTGSPPPSPSWRKPAGVLGILAYIAAYCALIVSQWPLIAATPVPVQAVIYLIAGIAWIAPLRPVLKWMETGRLR